MIPYILIFLLIMCLIYKYDIQLSVHGRRMWENIVITLLILMAGLRYHIGSDTIQYEYFFNNAPRLSELLLTKELLRAREPLWLLLTSVVKSVWDNFILFQVVIAILFNILLLNFLRKTTSKTFTSLLIIYCVCWWNFNFEIMRESVGVVLFLHSLLWLSQKNYLKYIILSIIIIFIHRFSFIVILLTPLVLFQNRKVVYPILFLAMFYTLIFMDKTVINAMLEILMEFSPDSASSKIGLYIDSTTEGFHSINIVGMIELLILSIIFPIFVIMNRKDIHTGYNKFFPILIGLYILFSIFKAYFSIAGRLNSYLEIIFIVELTNALYNFKIDRNLKIVFQVMAFLFVFQGCYYFYKPTYYETRKYITYDVRYIPYATIFDDVDKQREALIR